VNSFTRQALPTVNRKRFFVNILSIESFRPQKAHNRTLLFGSVSLKHGYHFDYWYKRLNMRMRVCYLDCYEAGLCCYLLTHIETLLRPLQLCYFHLWRTYWLFSYSAEREVMYLFTSYLFSSLLLFTFFGPAILRLTLPNKSHPSGNVSLLYMRGFRIECRLGYLLSRGFSGFLQFLQA
jgi:hypothetical protein